MANSTLENGLALLSWLAERGGLHSLTEIAQTFDWPKSHAHRLLQSLVEKKFCYQEANGKRYGAGLKVLELSHVLLSQIHIRRISMPLIQKLADDLDSDVIISLPHEGCALIVASAFPKGDQHYLNSTIGTPLQPNWSASGTLVAAHTGKLFEPTPKQVFEYSPSPQKPIRVLRKMIQDHGTTLTAIAYSLLRNEELIAILGIHIGASPLAKLGEGNVLNQSQECARRLQDAIDLHSNPIGFR